MISGWIISDVRHFFFFVDGSVVVPCWCLFVRQTNDQMTFRVSPKLCGFCWTKQVESFLCEMTGELHQFSSPPHNKRHFMRLCTVFNVFNPFLHFSRSQPHTLSAPYCPKSASLQQQKLIMEICGVVLKYQSILSTGVFFLAATQLHSI